MRAVRYLLGACVMLSALCACAVTPVGYGGGYGAVGYGYEGDFYEPYGYDYGGWGGGYRVGPPRGGDWDRGHGRPDGRPHPPGRPGGGHGGRGAPSIPGAHGGGAGGPRGGGAHGGRH